MLPPSPGTMNLWALHGKPFFLFSSSLKPFFSYSLTWGSCSLDSQWQERMNSRNEGETQGLLLTINLGSKGSYLI